MFVAFCVRFCHRGRPGSIPWNSLWDLWWIVFDNGTSFSPSDSVFPSLIFPPVFFVRTYYHP